MKGRVAENPSMNKPETPVAGSDASPSDHTTARPADTVTDMLEDIQDLQHTRKENEMRLEKLPFWKRLGPGLITGAADDDPSGIGTYSIAGAAYGYLLLWRALICLPLMIAVQEMCGRVSAITGKGLAEVIKEHYPRWILWGSVLLL